MRPCLLALALCVAIPGVQGQTATAKKGAVIPKPPDIILDCDFGPDPGDYGALATLHALADRREANILAVLNCNTNPYGPGAISAINRYYGRPNLPVGQNLGAPLDPGPEPNAFNKTLAEVFPNSFGTNGAAAPSAVHLYRKILASRPDKSVTIVANGQLANLESLRGTKGDRFSKLSGDQLLRKKCQEIVISAGQYPGGFEYNFYTDPGSASNFVNQASAPLRFNGFEVGLPVGSAGTLVSRLTPDNPVRFAFDRWFTVSGDATRPSWDQIGILRAVRKLAHDGVTYWSEAGGGRNVVSPDGSNHWDTSAARDHRYLVADLNPALVSQAVDELMEKPPALLAPRPVTQRDLVAHGVTAFWRFDETTGSTRFDSVHGIALADILSNTATVPGAIGNAAALTDSDRSNGFVTPYTPDLVGGNEAFSVSVLLKLRDKSHQMIIIDRSEGGLGKADYVLYLDGGTDRFTFALYNGGLSIGSVAADNLGSPQTGVWYLITCAFAPQFSGEDGMMMIRVNELPPNHALTRGPPDGGGNSRLAIGLSSWNLEWQNLAADVEWVMFAKKVFTNEDAKWLYNGGNFREWPLD